MKITVAHQHFTAKIDRSPSLATECISMRHGDAPDKLAKFMSESGVWNTVQDDPDMTSRLVLAANLIQNPQLFLTNPSKEVLTPVNRPSNQSPLQERRWKFRSTAEKEFVLSMIERYVGEIAGAKGITDTVLSIADELFTNALFNAPFGDLDSTLDRSTMVVLDPEMSSEIIMGHTSERLFIGCIDSFGTLNCDNLLDRIFRGFNDGIANAVNMEHGGAGIGILRMVDLSADIYVVVEKEKKTLVGCSFVLKRSPKKIRQTGKSFHFQSFQSITSPSAEIRVERRGQKALLRLKGDITEEFPFGDLDLTGIEEISLDLRNLQLSRPESLRVPLEILKNTPSLNGIFLEYVPLNLILEKQNSFFETGTLGEVRSILLPLICPVCKQTEDFLFLKDNGKLKVDSDPQCVQCQKNLEPESPIKKWIEK